MIKELKTIEFLKNYKGARVQFLKAGDNNYVEGLQMLLFLDGVSEPVYATKLNAFEIYKVTDYKLSRRFANIPFIFNSEKVEVKKIRMKDAEHKKLKKFLSKFRYKTANMAYSEFLGTMSKLDGTKFNCKEKKPKRTNVTVVNV